MVAMIDILEFSGIAWPNPGMWMQAQSRSNQGPVSGGQRPFVSEVKEDEDAHAHSPRRPSHQGVSTAEGFNSRRYPDLEDYWADQSMPPPPNRAATAAWNQSASGESNIIRQNGLLADPFLDARGLGTVNTHRENKKFSEEFLGERVGTEVVPGSLLCRSLALVSNYRFAVTDSREWLREQRSDRGLAIRRSICGFQNVPITCGHNVRWLKMLDLPLDIRKGLKRNKSRFDTHATITPST